MKIQQEPFEMIKSGKKIYELRLLDEKRKALKVGDYIEFTSFKTGEMLNVEIVDILHFSSFIDLYKALSPLEIGYTEQNCHTASHLDMQKYYSESEQKTHGVVAIKIKRV